MQEHPVPHNVLEIEFKLFGAFSVRQFVRILLGGAAALFIYILNLPGIIAVPLIIVALGLGIGSALIKNFNAQASTILSAILVSPRYIWKREVATPEFLVKDYQNNLSQATQTATKATKVKVSDFELEELLKVRKDRRTNAPAPATGTTPQTATQARTAFLEESWKDLHPGDLPPDNFKSQYEEAFGATNKTSVPVGPGQYVNLEKTNNAQKRPFRLFPKAEETPISQEEKNDQIEPVDPTNLSGNLAMLQNKLNVLQKQGASKAELDNIRAQIDDVYKKIKVASVQQKVEIQQRMEQLTQGNYIFGIVVDKGENPISDVDIKIKDASSQMVVSQASSQTDGRFNTQDELPIGDYIVTLNKAGYRFDQYKIPIKQGAVPAFKFKAK